MSLPRRLLCQVLCWAIGGVGTGGEEGWESCLLSLCEVDRHTRPDRLRSWKEASVHRQGSREGTPGRGRSVVEHGDLKEWCVHGVGAFEARLTVIIVLHVRLLQPECEFHQGRGFCRLM